LKIIFFTKLVCIIFYLIYMPNMKHLFKLFCFSILFNGSTTLYAQQVLLGGTDMQDEQQRNLQLLGSGNKNYSFTLRPFFHSDSSTTNTKSPRIKILPLVLNQQYNTFAPYGWNDGAMIPAKGYQAMISGGFFAQMGKFSLQVRPEIVYAANPDFERFPVNETDDAKYLRTVYLNEADMPERFGDKPFQRIYLGQSSLRWNHKSISVGLSNENLWWGPGVKNSLIMSNHAPGFLHLTANTTKPVQTKIGSFEGQLIAGRLEASGFNHDSQNFMAYGTNWEEPKPQDWRYISGITLNYQPKWVPGLFVGINRVFQIYRGDMGNGFGDYFPILSPFQKKNTNNEDAKKRDQLASVFLRWKFEESKSEIYFEYGRNDHAMSFWDFFQSAEHSRAYLLGFRKVFWLNQSKSRYLKINLEHTQMQQSEDRYLRPPDSWYLHYQVKHGYTHRGELLGAGIGPGSNLQTFDLSIWEPNRILGFQLERYLHNQDYFFRTFDDYRRKWADLMFNTYAYRRYGNLGVQVRLNAAWIRNYQWQLNNHQLNMQFFTSLMYHF